MAANRTEYTTADHRDDGLLFDWKVRRTPGHRMFGIFLVALAVFVFPLMSVHIQMGGPLIHESQPASMMVLLPGNDPMLWHEAARKLGPSPSRFEPADWRPSRVLLDDVLAGAIARSIPEHEPRFQDLPEDPPPPAVPLLAKGARHLPPVAAPRFDRMEAVEARPRPVLYPLSVDAGELPEEGPVFEVEVTPEMSSQPWRFLLQIAPDGAVLHAVALIGHNTPGRAELTDWLQAHQFPPHDHADGRWVAVAVTFQNLPADGIDDL